MSSGVEGTGTNFTRGEMYRELFQGELILALWMQRQDAQMFQASMVYKEILTQTNNNSKQEPDWLDKWGGRA